MLVRAASWASAPILVGGEAKQIGQTWAAQATTRTSTTPTAAATARATTKVAAAITGVAREPAAVGPACRCRLGLQPALVSRGSMAGGADPVPVARAHSGTFLQLPSCVRERCGTSTWLGKTVSNCKKCGRTRSQPDRTRKAHAARCHCNDYKSCNT